MYLQAEFNAGFETARNSRQAEVDKILDANNRMKEIWEEQARTGSGSGSREGSLFKPRGGLDDTEDGVLSVKVLEGSILMHGNQLFPFENLSWLVPVMSVIVVGVSLCFMNLSQIAKAATSVTPLAPPPSLYTYHGSTWPFCVLYSMYYHQTHHGRLLQKQSTYAGKAAGI